MSSSSLTVLALGLLTLGPRGSTGPDPTLLVRGVTISCQTYGPEWGTDGFGRELDELVELGVNWVAIHPYASIRRDGRVRWRFDAENPPEWLVRPIAEARRRGLKILVKPHLAYWGSGFSWRGDIDFQTAEEQALFFETYSAWMLELVSFMGDADAIAVGTELDRLVVHEEPWRRLIAALRERTDARLTYAANWTDYLRVPFWDCLDAIGVQGYFPLVGEESVAPSDEDLRRGWRRVLVDLRSLSEKTGKPVVLTELGYNHSLSAAVRPWEFHRASPADADAAKDLQARCLSAALAVMQDEKEWLRGGFLWKWFVGPAPGENFLLDTPELRAVMRAAWTI